MLNNIIGYDIQIGDNHKNINKIRLVYRIEKNNYLQTLKIRIQQQNKKFKCVLRKKALIVVGER